MKDFAKRLFINRDYGLLFSGRLVSQIGDGIHYFALAWLILDLTGSGAALGTLLMAASAPSIALAPFTGVLADTLDRKRIIVSMDIIRGLIMLILGYLYLNNMTTLPILYLATIAISLCSVLFGPAISATIPNLVQKDELVQANARDSFSMSATGILGPIAGALLLGAFGYVGIFLINGLSFLISALSEMFIQFPAMEKQEFTTSSKNRFFANFRSGLAYIWSNTGLRSLIVFATMLNFISTPLFSVVFPFFGKEVLQMEPSHFGIAQSSFPAGMLIGTLLVGFITARICKHKLLSTSIALQGVLVAFVGILALPMMYTILGPITIVLGLAIPIFLMGVLNVQVNVPFRVLLQETVPDNYRGRVFGLLESMVQVFVPISMGLFGVLLDIIPSFYFLLICGLASVSIGFAMASSAPLQQLYAKPVAEDRHNNELQETTA